MNEPVGVLVMAYGSPASPADIEEYYTHIRRGRPPEPAQLDELRSRYERIGGVTTLAERTTEQVERIRRHLDRSAPGRYRVVVGYKHAAPFIEDAAAELVAAGVEAIVALVLAPHYSKASVGEYLGRAREAAGAVEVRAIESWHLEPALIGFLAAAIEEELAALPKNTKLFFTAHSLPERLLADDPYVDLLLESAGAVARRVGLQQWPDWALAWQSAGRTPEPWRGPDILTVMHDLAETGRAEGVLVCPQGFVADHLEVLYDLDVEALGVADELGLAFSRTRSINDDDEVMGALARLVEERAEGIADA